MAAPTIGDATARIGLIVESWRLWEAILVQAGSEFRRVADWRLDADYFVSDKYDTLAVIAQGASLAADAVERLNGSGCRTVVRIGTCGGIQPEQAIGDVVVANAAVREEGTSTHYLPSGFPAVADSQCVRKVADCLSAQGLVVRTGTVWTTDGRWTESDEAIAAYRNLGVLAVDMETAGFYAASIRRGVSACSISMIADRPIDDVSEAFKGLPKDEKEWLLVCERATLAIATLLQRPASWVS